MKTEVKALWLTALRSGEYAQGSMRLQRSDNTFCCLGVLCDLAVKAGVIAEPVQELNNGSYMYGASGNAAFLPPEVGEWANVNRWGQRLDEDGATTHDLASMNDEGATFDAIADAIEKHF